MGGGLVDIENLFRQMAFLIRRSWVDAHRGDFKSLEPETLLTEQRRRNHLQTENGSCELNGGSFLLTVGALVLTVELLCLQSIEVLI